MGKANELSRAPPNLIVANHTDCTGYSRISELLTFPMSTVGAIIWKRKEQNFYHEQVLAAGFQTEEWKELSEELSKSQAPLVESYRKTFNQQVQLFQIKQ